MSGRVSKSAEMCTMKATKCACMSNRKNPDIFIVSRFGGPSFRSLVNEPNIEKYPSALDQVCGRLKSLIEG